MPHTQSTKVLQLLKQARLIESIERPGNTTLRRPKPQSEWVAPDRLQELRSLSTPTKSDSTLLPELIALPLIKFDR
ncbi:hypothetical protein CSQ79_16210 [Gloeocapsopsis sp. IPPAS B-1203]|nr:hypothetical protein CSQ79_16210 [Gloeocapsopsis sp. IPPAS B-1203]